MRVHVTNLLEEQSLPAPFIARLQKLAEEILDRFGLAGAEVGIIVAGDDYLQHLNRSYRGIDRPTDVLSFPLLEKADLMGAAAKEELLLGDVYISLERARVQAREAGHDPERETMLLAVHGLLHLLGYDHGEPVDAAVMHKEEEAILKAFM